MSVPAEKGETISFDITILTKVQMRPETTVKLIQVKTVKRFQRQLSL